MRERARILRSASSPSVRLPPRTCQLLRPSDPSSQTTSLARTETFLSNARVPRPLKTARKTKQNAHTHAHLPTHTHMQHLPTPILLRSYYGLQLLGDALGDAGMRDWGRAAMAAEVVAAQTYWQMRSDSKVYPAILRKKTVRALPQCARTPKPAAAAVAALCAALSAPHSPRSSALPRTRERLRCSYWASCGRIWPSTRPGLEARLTWHAHRAAPHAQTTSRRPCAQAEH